MQHSQPDAEKCQQQRPVYVNIHGQHIAALLITCSAGLSQQQRCRCGMCSRVLYGRSRRRSAMGFWLGRYTVLRVRYGEGNQELSARNIVWVVPWRTQGWKLLLTLGIVLWVILAR